MKHGPCLLTKKKQKNNNNNKQTRIQAFETKCSRKHLCISCLEHETHDCAARSASFWIHMTLFWQLSRDGNLHRSGISHATTASPKPSFRAPWRMGDAVVGRRNVGLTTSNSGHPCPCQNCSQGPCAEKTGRRSLLNRPVIQPV